MRDYIIVTDADSEMPLAYVEKWNLPVFAMPFMMDGTEYLYDLGKTVNIPDFFYRLGQGSEVSTSTRPYWEIKEWFKQYTDQGLDVLYLCFSNKLSAHHGNSLHAREELLQEEPDKNIIIVDTLSISLGQSQLVLEALRLKEEGKSIQETAAWLEENKKHSLVYFMVDDLDYLKRGGRLSGASAFFGGILDIKPLLHTSDAGELVPLEKGKGKKRILRRFLELFAERAFDKTTGRLIITISIPEDGPLLKGMFLEQYPDLAIEIWEIGPVIGGHVGPGVLGISFFGSVR